MFYASESNITGLLSTIVGPVTFLPEIQGYKKLIDDLKQQMTTQIDDIARASESARTMAATMEDLITALDDFIAAVKELSV